MKDYKKSDYALNKNRKGIVYRNADGGTLEITFEKIAEGKTQFTYEDFQKLKQFSDSIYLEQVKADSRYSYYVKGSYDEIPDSAWLATKSLEAELFGDAPDYLETHNVTLISIQEPKFSEDRQSVFLSIVKNCFSAANAV